VIPPRYEPLQRLGAGGGGEVWAVKDRVTGEKLAFKVLASGAGAPEVEALVREAVALSGLEGLGVPRVVAFGALPDGRRYMVRELVEGRSLDDVLQGLGPWIEPIASACDQLTVVHRAGLLHGDLKPANVIVGEGGRGTLVDLGLAAPWREGGTRPQGLTPKYAAPELFEGEPLTVRAEVYALGATLSEALARRGDELPDDVRLALARVAARATEASPSARWPSVDEFASALRLGARPLGALASSDAGRHEEAPWPVVGVDGPARALLEHARALAPGAAIAVQGPAGSGRTTLLRRLAWSLGVEGLAVAMIEAPQQAQGAGSPMRVADVVALELAQHADRDRGSAFVLIDDGEALDAPSRQALAKAAQAGARLVVVGTLGEVEGMSASCDPFEVPPLDPEDARALVRRSMPSLPAALQAKLVRRTDARPGALRAAVRRLAGRAIVSEEDIESALGQGDEVSSADRGRELEAAERALAMGRFGEARRHLDGLGQPRDDAERVRIGLARAQIAMGGGDTQGAVGELAKIEGDAASLQPRAWQVLRARAHLRAGEYSEAEKLARAVVESGGEDPLASDALSVRGVVLAFTGEDAAAREALDAAVRVARASKEPRLEAVALGSAAIVHQRAGRTGEARAAYEGSIAAAERARDAATVAAMRLNLAMFAHGEGDFAQALAHLEAAVDMGLRAGSAVVVTQALLNLANLDLYLGRWARARASIDQLAAQRDQLGPAARAQLLGLEAEHAARTGDLARGALLYEAAAEAWTAQGRAHDAAEARLEGLLARARAGTGSRDGTSPAVPGRGQHQEGAKAQLAELDAIERGLGDAGLGEHAALAQLVRGTIAQAIGDEEGAKGALDRAVELARKDGRRELAWQALDARGRLATAQGSVAIARRDSDSALEMLEETAAKLPRDLREVYWDDPRRRALRQSLVSTVATPSIPTWLGAGGRAAGTSVSLASRPAQEDRLARILAITRELATEHDVPRLLQRVTDHAVALLGAERGLVVLVGEKGELEAHAARVRSGDDEPHARFSRSVADKVIASGEPVVTISARDDERLAEAVSVHKLMIQSIACVPIRGAPPLGPTIGALYVETRLRPGVRFQEELPTLGAFADQAAISIENARLLAENRRRADELASANSELETARGQLERLLGKRTEQLAEARRGLKQARAELRNHFGYADLVGTSAAMRRLYAIIDRVKDTDVPVLITGESGTGKEMVAKAVHGVSPRGRARRPFIGVNCGAIPANLLESELFGSVRGAFTGADRDRRGVFQEAQGGTLLLDEIGEMPPKMQAGLLRVLQEKCVRPVGGTVEAPIDVRVIAATNRDLAGMVAQGTFREDLYYRLHVVELRVPPLRERVEDIPPLVDHFLSLFSTRYRRERKTVAREAIRKLCAYPWPGNVRQLEHVLLSAWLMGDKNEISATDVELSAPVVRSPPARPSSAPPGTSPSSVRPSSEAEFKGAERERILGALTASNWNRAQAAKMLGVPRRTFYRRLKEFGIL
jgi:transcriptional regulator with GAF, ATPase, and Fis domain